MGRDAWRRPSLTTSTDPWALRQCLARSRQRLVECQPNEVSLVLACHSVAFADAVEAEHIGAFMHTLAGASAVDTRLPVFTQPWRISA